MKIIVNDTTIYLSPWLCRSDVPYLVKWLQDKDISDKWSGGYDRIPYPYYESHALTWLNKHQQYIDKYGKLSSAAIRDHNKNLIGEIDFVFNVPVNTRNTAEISYWLAKPYWGTGITTAVVREMCNIGFNQFHLNKIVAHVEPANIGSNRVLQKNRFTEEGYLKEHFCNKNGTYYDVKLYGLISKEWET